MKQSTFQLTNNNGIVVEFISLGARITAVKLPHDNQLIDIVVGYDSPEKCAQGDGYMGAICGRMANRIDQGRFSLINTNYQLEQNDGYNHLHGGSKGYHTKYWEVNEISLSGYPSACELSLFSPDGDENYPGNLDIKVIYALNDNNELLIDYKAKTDKKTIINLTSHPYFNLKGEGEPSVLDHVLEINADYFTPIKIDGIPTGEIKSVKNTGMDFNAPTLLKDRVLGNDEYIKQKGGLDHNWVINKGKEKLSFAARVTEPATGRTLEVYTTQPGIQVYTALHFDGSEHGKGGFPIKKYSGIALEAQNFPDAPNHNNFPSTELNPGETYHQQVIYKFIF
jgi:aldose 1-epimerase